MGLLQPEDLGNHVLCGGVQQDPSGSQAHHYVSAHWRQAYRNGIGTWGPTEESHISQNACHSMETTFTLFGCAQVIV